MKCSVIVFDSQRTLQPPHDSGFDPIDTPWETVFYTMSVYFLAAKVTKTRYTLTGELLATLAGTVASVVLTQMML